MPGKRIGSQQQLIIDKSDLRKWRTELPNIFDDIHLTPYQYRMLGHYMRRGVTWESVRTTAEHCKISVGMVVKVRTQLEEMLLITVEENELGTYTADVADVWEFNFDYYSKGEWCSPDELWCSLHEHLKSRVHTMNAGAHGVNQRSTPSKKGNQVSDQEKTPVEERRGASARPLARKTRDALPENFDPLAPRGTYIPQHLKTNQGFNYTFESFERAFFPLEGKTEYHFVKIFNQYPDLSAHVHAIQVMQRETTNPNLNFYRAIVRNFIANQRRSQDVQKARTRKK